MGIPSTWSLGRTGRKATAERKQALWRAGVASDDLIPLNRNLGSVLRMRVDRNLAGLVCRNNTPMAGSLTQTKRGCSSFLGRYIGCRLHLLSPQHTQTDAQVCPKLSALGT